MLKQVGLQPSVSRMFLHRMNLSSQQLRVKLAAAARWVDRLQGCHLASDHGRPVIRIWQISF